jgi:4-hydroxybenzoyl-CoA thioesterase
MFAHSRSITIEWGDCDPAGIVYYPRYFQMFDTSTAELFRAALDCTKLEMMRRFDFAGFPMVDTGARFSTPSRFGDEVTIESRIEHRLMRGSQIAIEAHEKRVWVRRKPGAPDQIEGTPLPQQVIDALSRDDQRI